MGGCATPTLACRSRHGSPDPHAPDRSCGILVRRLHIDPRERRRCRASIPTALVEGTSVHARRRTRVREDHPERTGKPPGTLADAEVVFAPDPARSAPHAGRVCRLGASRCGETRDVSRPAVLRQWSAAECPAPSVLQSSTRSIGTAPAVPPRRVQPPRGACLTMRNRRTARPMAQPSGARSCVR
jgi:hypothetical protein